MTDLKTRKQPRQARAIDKVNRVLDAGEKILIETGFESITTPRIAEQSGVTVGSIYQYFPNKESILQQLFQRWLDQAFEIYRLYALAHVETSSAEAYFTGLFLAQTKDLTEDQHRLSVELTNAARVNKQLQALDLAHDQRLLSELKKDWLRLQPAGDKHRINLTFMLELSLNLLDMISRAPAKKRKAYIEDAIRTLSTCFSKA